MNKIFAGTLILLLGLFLVSATYVNAQYKSDEVCWTKADYDSDIDADDVGMFLKNLGRNLYNNPCPPEGPAMVPATGQFEPVIPRDDGYIQAGIVMPMFRPRFTNLGNGTIQDNLTGLIWLENAQCGPPRNWVDAIDYIAQLGNGSDCDSLGFWTLTDGSSPGDWRLPNANEIESLRNMAYSNPALSNTSGRNHWTNGDAFLSVVSDDYWTSTSIAGGEFMAWRYNMGSGALTPSGILATLNVWPVKAGIVMPNW